jgi:hypothetical protein
MRLLAATFDAVTVRRAIAYVEEGRVHLVKPPPWPVVARVRGTEGYVTTVRALPSGHHLRGSCTCPVEIDCKHARRDRAGGAAARGRRRRRSGPGDAPGHGGRLAGRPRAQRRRRGGAAG